ncbi:glycosyltransferase family 39 protein [Candidatus Roizmanbacteria bacterium]|nr:glycosyltransferase family 39 protein [Candidatus Roizmanbacteria bacterium]
MKRIHLGFLVGILILGFVLRIYRFDSPIADWHSWRQADTSSVSRIFVENGFDLLHPKYHDLSNVPSGLNNPEGYRFVEFPVYNFFQAGLFKLFPVLTLEEWGRLITIFVSMSSALLIFLILKKHQNERAGLMGAFVFAALPYSIYYGRTILPDTSTAAAILAGIYFFDLWLGEKVKYKKFIFYFLSILFTTTSFLLKPFAMFFTLPMLYLAYQSFGVRMIVNPYLWVFAIASLFPITLWRQWMTQFPEGIPGSNWLFNEGGMRFKGAFFNWIFAERISKLILGYWGVFLVVLGLVAKTKTSYLFFYSFLVSSILYVTVIARGNIQHDYYQILILPTLCIFAGLGGDFLLTLGKNLANKYLAPVVLIGILGFAFMFSWYQVRDYFNINNRAIITAGSAVDRLTPKDSLVIANYEGDTSFLYQTKRRGWSSYQDDLNIMVRDLGADYLVIANPKPADDYFKKNYAVLEETSEYVIFDLRKRP